MHWYVMVHDAAKGVHAERFVRDCLTVAPYKRFMRLYEQREERENRAQESQSHATNKSLEDTVDVVPKEVPEPTDEEVLLYKYMRQSGMTHSPHMRIKEKRQLLRDVGYDEIPTGINGETQDVFAAPKERVGLFVRLAYEKAEKYFKQVGIRKAQDRNA